MHAYTRPILRRLTQEYPRVREHVFGAFRECSRDDTCTHCFVRLPPRRRRGSGASAEPKRSHLT